MDPFRAVDGPFLIPSASWMKLYGSLGSLPLLDAFGPFGLHQNPFGPGMEPQSADGSGGKPKRISGEISSGSPIRGLHRPGYYPLTLKDIAKLEKQCSELVIPVNPGDVVLFAGGTMVHSSPAAPAGAAARFMTYAHWEQDG